MIIDFKKYQVQAQSWFLSFINSSARAFLLLHNASVFQYRRALKSHVQRLLLPLNARVFSIDSVRKGYQDRRSKDNFPSFFIIFDGNFDYNLLFLNLANYSSPLRGTSLYRSTRFINLTIKHYRVRVSTNSNSNIDQIKTKGKHTPRKQQLQFRNHEIFLSFSCHDGVVRINRTGSSSVTGS